jgi:hypothetical protein
MSTKELQEKIVWNMRRWQKIEDAAVVQTGEIMAKTENPIIRMVMNIINADSQTHYRVQGLIADGLESGTVSLSYDDLSDVWDMIEKHIEIEKKTISMAKDSLEAIKGKKMVVEEYLLNYPLQDETKHDKLLDDLALIRKGMYPY